MSCKEQTVSPFAEWGMRYFESGFSVLPVRPGSKVPGTYLSSSRKWINMKGWSKYCTELPSADDVEEWSSWPGAGITLMCGPASNVVAIDYDDRDDLHAAICAGLGKASPVRKKGKRGYTEFFRYNGERSRSFEVDELTVVEILSEGSHTLLPPSIHPDTKEPYVWLTPFDLLSLD